MSASPPAPRFRPRKWLLRLLAACGLLLPLVLAGMWLAVQHVPDWYVPPAIPPRDYQKVRDDFEAVFNEISEKLMSSEPFTLVLKDRQLNNWLAIRGQILPETARWLPEYLEDPMVRFDNDMLTVAGTATRGSVRSVVSLGWQLEVGPETIVARLRETRSGSLPLSHGLISKALARVGGDSPSSDATALGGGLNLAGKIRQAGTGLDIENRFRWKNGDRLFRITSLESRGGVVRVKIQPLDDPRRSVAGRS